MKVDPNRGKGLFTGRKDFWAILAESLVLFVLTLFDLGKMVITTQNGQSGTNIRFTIYQLQQRLGQITRSLGYLSIEIQSLPLIQSLITAAQALTLCAFAVLFISLWFPSAKTRRAWARIGFFLYAFVFVALMVAAPIVDNEIRIASSGIILSIIQLSAIPYLAFFAGALSLASVSRPERGKTTRPMTARRLAISGVLTAFVLLATSIVKIPVPATGGYIHPGDGVILFAAMLLGPQAAIIGGIGSALADLLGGYFVYILPTFLVKAIMGGVTGFLLRGGKTRRAAIAFALSAALMVFGYFVAEGLLFSYGAALASVIPNILQGAAAVAIALVLSFSAPALKKFL